MQLKKNMEKSTNKNEDALQALEDALSLLGENSSPEVAGGVCVWVTDSGKKFCAPISEEQYSKIKGAVSVSGGMC